MTKEQAWYLAEHPHMEIASVRSAHEVEYVYRKWVCADGSVIPVDGTPQPAGGIEVGRRLFQGRPRP
jgi:hypothetical protein